MERGEDLVHGRIRPALFPSAGQVGRARTLSAAAVSC
jgi:hypothetical protein